MRAACSGRFKSRWIPAATSTWPIPRTAACSNTTARSQDAALFLALEEARTWYSGRPAASPRRRRITAGSVRTASTSRPELRWMAPATSTCPTTATAGCSSTTPRLRQIPLPIGCSGRATLLPARATAAGWAQTSCASRLALRWTRAGISMSQTSTIAGCSSTRTRSLPTPRQTWCSGSPILLPDPVTVV